MSVARQYMYEDLQDHGWSHSDDSQAYQRYEEQHDVPNVKKIPKIEFWSEDKLIVSDKPVVIIVTYEDGQYYATNDTLNIFSVGENIASVIADFSHHVMHFYGYYADKDFNELTGNALRLKQIYASFQKIA